MRVRKAEKADCQDIFNWRNNFVSRQMFHNTNVVGWDEHIAWFEKVLSSHQTVLLICAEASDKKIAVVRFDIEETCVEVSINTNPDMRGRGYGKQCLNAAIAYFIGERPSIMRAEIKDENIVSKKAFEAAGFAFENQSVARHIIIGL